MQLKIDTELKKSIITVSLETINFTPDENKLLDQFGEMKVDFEKSYPGNFNVSIHKKIRSNFKIKIKFDGTEQMDKAVEAVNMFLEEFQEYIDESYDTYLEEKQDYISGLDEGVGSKISKVVSQDINRDLWPIPPHLPDIHALPSRR